MSRHKRIKGRSSGPIRTRSEGDGPQILDKTEETAVKNALDKLKEIHDIGSDRIRSVEELAERVEAKSEAVSRVADSLSTVSDAVRSLDAQVAGQAKAMEQRLAQAREEIQERIDGLEAVRTRGAAAPVNEGLADRLFADPDFRAAAEDQSFDWRHRAIRVDGLNILAQPVGRLRADPVMGSTELSPYGTTMQGTTLLNLLAEKTDLISMVPRIGLGGRETWDFPRRTKDSHLAYVSTTTTVAIASIDTTITVDDTRGFIDDTQVRVSRSAGGFTTFWIEVTSGTVLTILDAPGGSPTASGITEAGTGLLVTSENFGATAESGLKPVTVYKVERPTRTVKTFANAIITTRQRLTNVGTLQREMESELVRGARRNFSFHFLYGDGSASQANGLTNETDLQTYLWSSGVVGDFRADAVAKASNEIHSDDPIWLVLNKRDWTTLTIEKAASDGHYAIIGQHGPMLVTDLPGQKALGPHPVMTDGAVRIGDFFLIDFAASAEWGDKEDGALIAGHIDQQLLKNELTMLYEQSWEVAVRDVSGYVFGQWDSAPV
jgi:hypothetical protein